MMEQVLSDDEAMYRDVIAAYLHERYDDAERRRIIESDDGWDRGHWRSFAELGLLGAGLPERIGGLGGSIAEQALIAEQLGTALVVEPYVSTAVLGGELLNGSILPEAESILRALIGGEVRIAFAHGEPETRYNPAHVTATAVRHGDGYVISGHKAVVRDAAAATHLIVVARSGQGVRDRTGISLFLVDADAAGIMRRDYRTISGAMASDIQLSSLVVPSARLMYPEGEALPHIEAALDHAALAVCAEGLGVMARLHGDTVEYLRQRQQFGKPLASFQALQHRLVKMLIARQHASSIVERAVGLADAGPQARAAAVSAAKVYVGNALRLNGEDAIQLHGAMGMTDELALGWFFKRALEIERQFGDVAYHLKRFSTLTHGNSPVRLAAAGELMQDGQND